MYRFLLLLFCFLWQVIGYSQLLALIDSTITISKTKNIIEVLASDSFAGRGNFSPKQLLATNFIARHFDTLGLQPLNPCSSFLQSFIPFHKYQSFLEVELNGKWLDEEDYVFLPPCAFDTNNANIKFVVSRFNTAAGVMSYIDTIPADSSCRMLLLETKGDREWRKLKEKLHVSYKQKLLVIHTTEIGMPVHLSFRSTASTYQQLYNVMGVLPGKSKPNEIILFSAHYDHEGIKGSESDNIYNGANDDASGTTAVMLLAEYFAKTRQNERTLVFACFSGEELGLLGSTEFVEYINPQQIITVFNIEMIGRSQLQKGKAAITGANLSNFRALLNKSSSSTDPSFLKDEGAFSRLFLRSDNYSFAKLGIPAHTIICCSDTDPYYHTPADEVSTLDVQNMTTIICKIAWAALPFVKGNETPTRIKPALLQH